MNDAAAVSTENTVEYHAPAKAPPPENSAGPSFGEVISDLNPLQYLPIVGTIYRALTGETVPKPLREAGSVLVGGLMGGPLGAATSLATLAFEKLTGIDFEDVGQAVLARLGAGTSQPQAASVSPPASPASQPAHVGAWTAAQLSAYGVVTGADGSLRQGDLLGADVLNALQLGETHRAFV